MKNIAIPVTGKLASQQSKTESDSKNTPFLLCNCAPNGISHLTTLRSQPDCATVRLNAIQADLPAGGAPLTRLGSSGMKISKTVPEGTVPELPAPFLDCVAAARLRT